MPARMYYRVVCSNERLLAGVGLGYPEIYGDGPRFFWDKEQAEARADQLQAQADRYTNTTYYEVEEGSVYPDGTFDDQDDECAREQLDIQPA